jgi:hypothetical protein
MPWGAWGASSQQCTVPLVSSPHAVSSPVETEVKVMPWGAVALPKALSPQQCAVPLVSTPHVNEEPAETEVKMMPAGTVPSP